MVEIYCNAMIVYIYLDRFGGEMVIACSPRVRKVVGLIPGRMKPKTLKLLFVASPPRHAALKSKCKDWSIKN